MQHYGKFVDHRYSGSGDNICNCPCDLAKTSDLTSWIRTPHGKSCLVTVSSVVVEIKCL